MITSIMFRKILFLATVTAVFLGCETTEIAVNRAVLSDIKTVAVLDFEVPEGTSAEVAEEARGAIQSALLRSGFRVVEREKLLQLMAEKEFARDMGDEKSAAVLKTLVGADGVVFGKVLRNAQSRVKAVKDEGGEYETDRFEFLVQVRMTATGDGSLVFDLQNARTSHQNDPRFIAVESLAQFRGQVLAGLSADLVKAFTAKAP